MPISSLLQFFIHVLIQKRNAVNSAEQLWDRRNFSQRGKNPRKTRPAHSFARDRRRHAIRGFLILYGALISILLAFVLSRSSPLTGSSARLGDSCIQPMEETWRAPRAIVLRMSARSKSAFTNAC